MARPFRKILITGAASALGTELRHGLAPLAERLRIADPASPATRCICGWFVALGHPDDAEMQ